ncbi:tetratricopeptide repeat protein [uncultured Brachyspira sp.]|uniref:tetratricopeptide repeat protein n=1 Tax=uncultured Brachyspira sp. TaxID=221953 RepID=UPI00258A920A|nr:tetratricopeptide repeat protein [uncultured Brachyspira sp.]
MEQLYLEFDKEEFEKNLELFKRLQDEKNGDLEEAFTLFADKYINGEMNLPVFLQVVNKLYYDIDNINNIALYQQLLEGIEKVKKYEGKKDCKVGIINTYEILINIYNSMYDNIKVYELSKELLDIDEGNKIALLYLSAYEGEGKNQKLILNYSISDLAILNNLANYYRDNNEIDKAIKYYEIIISLTKNGNYLKEVLPYHYMWGYYRISNTQPYLPVAQSNLGDCYHTKYKEDKNIENYRNAEKLYKESIENYKKIRHQYIKDPIINLANLYYEEKKFEEAYNLIYKYSDLLPIDSDYYRLIGNCIYRENPCKETAKKSLESLKNSIRELNFIDPASFEYAMIDAFNTIMLMYEMKEKKHISYDAAKESLNQLYVYNAEKPNFNLQALPISFKINDYELCSKIAFNIINNYNIDAETYKIVLEYYIKSLHYLDGDNHEKIINELNKIDFNISKVFLIDIINEIAGKTVIDNTIEIKNEKVLISLYEIMSVSRKELIVIRLLDYVRNEHDKNKDWKDNIVEVKYKEKKYKLHYNYRCFKGKEGYNNNDYIAINQIRDTLSHSEHKCEVNKNVKEDEKAREFIEANFTSIIECLFNVIKENGLLTDDKFNSEDF